MSRHVTYRGTTLDMDSLRRENEKTPAIGNMKVNAKGDQIRGGTITKTADQIARDNHRVQSVILKSGLKGPIEQEENVQMIPERVSTPVKATKVRAKEVELPSGDIIVEDDPQ